MVVVKPKNKKKKNKKYLATEWRRTWSESCWLRFSTYCCLVIYHVQGGDCHWLDSIQSPKRLKTGRQTALKNLKGRGCCCCCSWCNFGGVHIASFKVMLYYLTRTHLEFLFGVPIWSVHSERPFGVSIRNSYWFAQGIQLHSQSNQSMGFPSRH